MTDKQAYEYAQDNGYKGTFAEYKKFNYAQYVKTCERNQITALTFAEWKRN